MFKIGERVFDIHFGWGVISEIKNADDWTYPIIVKYNSVSTEEVYCMNGCYSEGYFRTLYHHDYTPKENTIQVSDQPTVLVNEPERLTKREQFAGMAMQGILSGNDHEYTDDFRFLAQVSVSMADDLIQALNESKTQ